MVKRVVAVLAVVGLAALVRKELPAVRREIKILRM